jgi:hypothetical protein
MKEQISVALVIVCVLLVALAAASDEIAAGLLPEWVDVSQSGSVWIEMPFPVEPGAESMVTAASRYLIVKLSMTGADDWAQTAFDLKTAVVEARARSPQLKVGLDGDREVVEQLLRHGLAPYIDAHVYRHEPVLPTRDPTARLWWRTAASEQDLLVKLLEASRCGAELVLLEGITVDPDQRRLLAALQATGAAELVPQPLVSGIDRSRVHFFLAPDGGAHYLAVQAEAAETRQISFTLGQALEARQLYPGPADCELTIVGRQSRLNLSGEHRFALYELHSTGPEPPHDRIVVDGEVIIDPYEVVVKNQAFQEREARKVDTLDVTEVHDYLVQRPGSRTGRHHYRVIERRDQATDYIWTGWQVNGVEVPHDKMWQSHIYDDRVLLDPLAIELDRTYEYSYLGEETINGRPTWRIGFRPLAPGAYMSGTVWIDQEIHCQHRLHARHTQPQPPIGSRTITVHYQWVEDGGERFWTWTRIDDSHTWIYLGYHLPIKAEIVRSGHHFNRTDLREELGPIYQSDARIIRETVDGELRWLIPEEMRSIDDRVGDVDPYDLDSIDRVLDQVADAGTQTESFGRVLADHGAFSGTHRVGVLIAQDTDWRDDTYIYPYYSYFNLAVAGSPYQVFVNASELGTFSVARPGILHPSWTLSASLNRIEYKDREIGAGRDKLVHVFGGELMLSLAMPVHPRLALTTRLKRTQLIYDEIVSPDLDPEFVLPVNHWETTGRLEMRYDRRSFSSDVAIEYTARDDWQPWGTLQEATPQLQQSWVRASIQGGYYRQISRNQSIGISATWERGSGRDRFSRIRLNTGRLRVGGYTSRIRYDEGFGLILDYTGHFLELFPLRLQLDGAIIRPDRELDQYEHLAGVRLSTMLHGPWKTDIMLGIDHGLTTSIEPARNQELTFFMVWSRRFGSP